MVKLLHQWYRFLDLSVQCSSWYRARLKEELVERHAAHSTLERLSETSDVFYILGRAQFDGYLLRRPPAANCLKHLPIYAYMICKYTSRWVFYRTAAFLCGSGSWRQVREVVNPHRDFKIREVASRHAVDLSKFERVCHALRRVWPLLP